MEDKSAEITLTFEQQHIRDVFMLSFRYSQGDPDLQSVMFDWMRAGDFLSVGEKKEIENNPRPPEYIAKMRQPRKHWQPTEGKYIKYDPSEDVRDVWLQFRGRVLGPADEKLKSGLSRSILNRIIERERDYVAKGRPGRDVDVISLPDSINDPYASLVRKYIVLGNASGDRVFDELFQTQREFVDRVYKKRDNPMNLGVFDRHILFNLLDLQRKWEEKHEGKKFFESKAS